MCEVETIPEVTILNVDEAVEDEACDYSNIMCTIKVRTTRSESQDIELMLDTGSRVFILPESVVKELFTHYYLTKPPHKLKDYDGNPIAVKGGLQANVAFGGRSTNRKI